jgi:hypothetical protein
MVFKTHRDAARQLSRGLQGGFCSVWRVVPHSKKSNAAGRVTTGCDAREGF